MLEIDELTKRRFFALSMLVADVDGELSPTLVPAAPELGFAHGLFLHPSPLRTIGLWAEDGVWKFRYIELNISDGSVYRLGDIQTLAPVDHPKLPELLARMMARCGREIVAGVADRIIVPRDTVADVFDAHLASAARMSFSARTWLTRNGYQAEW